MLSYTDNRITHHNEIILTINTTSEREVNLASPYELHTPHSMNFVLSETVSVSIHSYRAINSTDIGHVITIKVLIFLHLSQVYKNFHFNMLICNVFETRVNIQVLNKRVIIKKRIKTK